MLENIVITSQTELYQLISQAVDEALANQKNQPPKENNSEYYTLKRACEYLHIAPQTMYALTSKRKIKFIKAFKNLLFTKSDLDEFLLNNQKETASNLVVNFRKGGKDAA